MSSIKIRSKRLDSASLVRILLTHPMETGRRQDKASGETIPPHYIQEVKIEHNGILAARCQFGTAVSRDPYISFRLRDTKSGDSVRVSWLDNLGQGDSESILIP